ncbi:MAG: hypothetical protein H7145_14945 [Akkermansiaceae bacterium]|nr:hypothetical protein [Armatimonadota bacterium]
MNDENHRDYTIPGDERYSPADPETATFFQTRCTVPRTALCLKVPNTSGEELVVHRENDQDYVFLFESLDDAYDYAIEASQALDFAPNVGRVLLRDLHFANARYKPALSEQIDLVLRTRY